MQLKFIAHIHRGARICHLKQFSGFVNIKHLVQLNFNKKKMENKTTMSICVPYGSH